MQQNIVSCSTSRQHHESFKYVSKFKPRQQIVILLSRKWLLITVACSNRTAAQWQHAQAKANGLDLEPTAVPSATSLLELPSLGAHIRLGVAVWHTRSLAKVSHCLTGVLGTPQKDLQKASIYKISLSSRRKFFFTVNGNITVQDWMHCTFL